MSESSDFKELLRIFNEGRVEYLIVGGYAVMKHSEPRYTKDLDVWVEASPENAARVFHALKEFGAPLSNIHEQDFTKEDLVYQIGVAPNRVDILMGISGIRFHEAWLSRVEGDFDGIPAQFISRRELIVAKRAAGRPQDVIDADLLELSEEISVKGASDNPSGEDSQQ